MNKIIIYLIASNFMFLQEYFSDCNEITKIIIFLLNMEFKYQ